MGSRSTEETHQILENVAVVVSSLSIWVDRIGKGFLLPSFPVSPAFGTLGIVQWGLLQTQSSWGAVEGEGSDSHSLASASKLKIQRLRPSVLLCNCKHKGLTSGNLFPIWLLVHYGKIASNFSFEEFQCDLLTSLSARRFFFLGPGSFCNPLLDSTS